MWVDQKDLKLYITGADMPRIHAAARLVGDLISKAPVNVNSAGVEDEVRKRVAGVGGFRSLFEPEFLRDVRGAVNLSGC